MGSTSCQFIALFSTPLVETAMSSLSTNADNTAGSNGARRTEREDNLSIPALIWRSTNHVWQCASPLLEGYIDP